MSVLRGRMHFFVIGYLISNTDQPLLIGFLIFSFQCRFEEAGSLGPSLRLGQSAALAPSSSGPQMLGVAGNLPADLIEAMRLSSSHRNSTLYSGWSGIFRSAR